MLNRKKIQKAFNLRNNKLNFKKELNSFISKRLLLEDIKQGDTIYEVYGLHKQSFIKKIYMKKFEIFISFDIQFINYKDGEFNCLSTKDANLEKKLNCYNHHLTFKDKKLAEDYLNFCKKYMTSESEYIYDYDGTFEHNTYDWKF